MNMCAIQKLILTSKSCLLLSKGELDPSKLELEHNLEDQIAKAAVF